MFIKFLDHDLRYGIGHAKKRLIVTFIMETKNPVFTVLKRQRCRNAQEVNDISTPFYTPFRPVVRYSNYQGCFLRLNPGWGQETNIDPDN